ncbi:hypothetical protein H671_3g9037 [Cricetulus griseus]|uniref:Uncharacterized protein n=1 Tax=Cricetulus griseus TaxID=10029 RepID=A0A061IA35_CRIGR|nr:hypothetical protein H671_3g9037 [Cricetulus griseus]
MASTSARNGDTKDSWPPQTPASLGGGQKVSLSRSEEFLSQISAELTDEALFIARSYMNSVPIKEKQTKDQGTQISRHARSPLPPFTLATALSNHGESPFSNWSLYFQCSSTNPAAQIHALTEIEPAARHTFYHLLVKSTVLECSTEQNKAPALQKWEMKDEWWEDREPSPTA